MQGKMVEPLDVESQTDIRAVMEDVFGGSGFNARRLAEAAEVWHNMIEQDATVCLTLSGAMTPIGMSGPIKSLIKAGLIDFIISTGANLYHDMHRPYDYPVRQGEFMVDDGALHKAGVVRIYDTFIEEDETLLTTDCCIVEAAHRMDLSKPFSTADFHKVLGQVVAETAARPERSFLASAAEYDLPVYCSAPSDSSIGMNLILTQIFEDRFPLDAVLDIMETTAIVRESELNGAVEVGGGHPKNFYMQTQPTLWQILHDSKGGHDFFIQLTTDAPYWGGLSGATPSEAHSWGKVRDPRRNNAVVYSCASITFPLLAMYMLATHKPRPAKRLMQKKDDWTEALKERARKNPKVLQDWSKVRDPDFWVQRKKK
jgi:deoxyhypusine synthase